MPFLIIITQIQKQQSHQDFKLGSSNSFPRTINIRPYIYIYICVCVCVCEFEEYFNFLDTFTQMLISFIHLNYFTLLEFFTPSVTDGFHWSLRDSKSLWDKCYAHNEEREKGNNRRNKTTQLKKNHQISQR